MPGKPPFSDGLRPVVPGEAIKADEENKIREIVSRSIDLPDSMSDSMGTRMATKSSSSPDELYWCMLMEAHPGRGVCFEVIVGVWCKREAKFRFDCSAVTQVLEKAIDWHFAAPEPDIGARGWFKKMPYYDPLHPEYKWIYVCVSLDCESPGECDAGTEDDGLTDGKCPADGTTPCVEV